MKNHCSPFFSFQSHAPPVPWEPDYNLHVSGRWVKPSPFYCFQRPLDQREACKPRREDSVPYK